MKIERLYKLYRLGIEIDPIQKEIIEFLEEKFHNLNKVEMKEYSDRIFYFNSNKKVIFETTAYNSSSVRWGGLWEILQNKYNLSYKDIKHVCQWIIEKNYKNLNIRLDSTICIGKIVEEQIDKLYCSYKHLQ